MTDEPDEEVQRVLDAIDSLGSEGDAADRARRLGQLLDGWPDAHAKVRAARQEAVREMKNEGMSLRAIGAELDMSFGRVRQILEGATTSTTNNAARKRSEDSSAGEAPA
ncbi:hypothetical protein ABZ820_34770 [Streptomyces diacarni]|uniref:hypothetical protein n=1 Tax=Streptomyces diacarni TaxID=2800381 RepID=UPI0033E6F160